jgi:DNA modification methylase
MKTETAWQLITDDCLNALPTIEESSIDACVTDPPYGLNMMGKNWDYGVPGVAYWKEVLRVLKPGAPLLAFGGTRTHHRLMTAIEDAGFELKDCCVWLYGSGFPKSLNISKAIDKAAGVEREVIGTSPNWRESKRDREKFGSMEVRGENAGLITAPATAEAKLWDGWGSALKPAYEPVILCRKPFPQEKQWDTLLSDVAVLLFNEEMLCQRLNVPANDAALIFQSTLPLFVKAAANSVPENAKIKNLAKQELARLAGNPSTHKNQKLQRVMQYIAAGCVGTAQEERLALQMATGVAEDSYEEMEESLSSSPENTGLSTALSWRNTLVVLWNQMRTFTTEMKTSLTTDLKILKSLVILNTFPNDTHKKKTPPNGEPSVVTIVETILKSASVKLSSRATITAQENAGLFLSSAKPAYEPIILAMKPLDGTYAHNALTHGVAGLNIDGCRIATTKHFGGLKNKVPEKYQQPQGRWPANVILDEEAGRMLDEQTKNVIHPAGHKKERQHPGYDKKSTPHAFSPIKQIDFFRYGDSGGASRFFYCAKTSRSERTNKGTITNDHPTIKPLALMQWLCRLVSTPTGGTILDPFAGSGSTGIAAMKEGLNFIGIEKEEAYAEIARKRLAAAQPVPRRRQASLFDLIGGLD